MSAPDFVHLVEQLAGDDPAQRLAARMILLALQEDAIDGLADVYYAGVTEPAGLTILAVMAEIGGPDALMFLRNVFNFEDERDRLKMAAARGLLRNRDNLSPFEMQDIMDYLIRAA